MLGSRSRLSRGPLLVVPAVLAVLLGAVGCGSAGGSPGASASPVPSPGAPTPPAPAEDTLSFSVVGDSITAGTLPIVGAEVPGVGSWVPAADVPPLEFAGGWAVPGATTEDMRNGVGPLSGDVVVLMGGTNDLFEGVAWEDIRSNLIAIAAATGVGKVVLAAVPPSDRAPAEPRALNEQLASLAAEQGWSYLDPWSGIGRDGRFVAGTSADGVHPTPEAAAVVGTRIGAALLGRSAD